MSKYFWAPDLALWSDRAGCLPSVITWAFFIYRLSDNVRCAGLTEPYIQVIIDLYDPVFSRLMPVESVKAFLFHLDIGYKAI